MRRQYLQKPEITIVYTRETNLEKVERKERKRFEKRKMGLS